MDERCALCGNHTAQMDLTAVAFEGLEVRACPYCRRQLEQTLKNPAENSDWLQSILSVDTKGVRTEEVTAALTRICYQNDIPRPQPQKASPKAVLPTAEAAVANRIPPATGDSAAKIASLEKRVESLEAQLQKLRRRMLISKILGAVIPVLAACILAIVLVRSSYFQNILDYYEQLGELANRM